MLDKVLNSVNFVFYQATALVASIMASPPLSVCNYENLGAEFSEFYGSTKNFIWSICIVKDKCLCGCQYTYKTIPL